MNCYIKSNLVLIDGKVDVYDKSQSENVFTNRLRLTQHRYPSGQWMTLVYEDGIDSLLNRPTVVVGGSTAAIRYTYAGLSTPMRVWYQHPDLTLDYTDGLDRFNRVVDHAWKKENTDVVRIQHVYDRAGNRLNRTDILASSHNVSIDENYTYDGVNQLIGLQRANATRENFHYDPTGNWSLYETESSSQSRTHNSANEITSIDNATTPVATNSAGNMTRVPQPENWSEKFDLTYDAWNRLVKVMDGASTVATYTYDGLNRRVKKTLDSETRLYYYNRSWQCVEEFVGATVQDRYFWGLRYIDELLVYRTGSTDYFIIQDANWNVIQGQRTLFP